MSKYLSPGVYVEEVPSAVKPIEGVGTSTAGFIGIAEKGPIGEAKLIANRTQFHNTFGGYIRDGYLAYAVNQFFNEGGTRCYVVRTCHYNDITNPVTKTAATSAVTLKGTDEKPSMRVMASSDGKWGNNIAISIESIEAKKPAEGNEPIEANKPAEENKPIEEKFNLFVKYRVGEDKPYDDVESYHDLTIKEVEDRINSGSTYIRVEKDAWKEGSENITGSGKVPVSISIDNGKLTGGNDGIDKDGMGNLQPADFEGDEKAKNGLHAFDAIDDVNIIAIPDRHGDRDTILKGLTYCQNRKDCFFIADPLKALDPVMITEFKSGTGPFKGNGFNSSYGALYYPWVLISDPLEGGTKAIPPSGAVAGTYAHTDTVRGVHKAPAGITEGYLDSVTGLERSVTNSEQDGLNPLGINVIRSFPSSGICIWGARTLSSDPEWKYVNIRRLLLFLEESIDEGTQWVVFEPNDTALWGKVKRNITAYLLRVWRDGAFFGSTPEEAFFVKVDEENNPPEVRDAGQLIIEIGVAPVTPAEFVIIRISKKIQSK